MKVSKKVFGTIMGISIGLVMSLFSSFFMIVTSVGFIEGFFLVWLKSFAMGFAISGPIALIAIPITERLLRQLFHVQE